VRWEWFYYGRPQITQNLYFFEFEEFDGMIVTKTNVDFYEPKLKPSKRHPAVEIT